MEKHKSEKLAHARDPKSPYFEETMKNSQFTERSYDALRNKEEKN